MQLRLGQTIPSLQTSDLHGHPLTLPDGASTVHLQFWRFAGCPICNMHLQGFVREIERVREAGIREIVVFHSPVEELLSFQGLFPFEVIADPEKKLYRLFGVETSLAAALHPATFVATLRGLQLKERPKMTFPPKGGPLGLPADFLFDPAGILLASKYGSHADDQWTLEEVLRLREFDSDSTPRREQTT